MINVLQLKMIFQQDVYIGNCINESAISEKLHGNKKIARGKAECYLNCCKCIFFQNCILIHEITY